jgi:hypothetical protein
MSLEPTKADTHEKPQAAKPYWLKATLWIVAIAILAFLGWHFALGVIQGITESMP